MVDYLLNLLPKENDDRVYDLVKKIHETRPGKASLAEYYPELRIIWQETNYYEDFQVDCASEQKNTNEKSTNLGSLCLGSFFQEYDEIRVQIIQKELFPSLMQAVWTFQSEESRQNVTLHAPQ